MVICNKKKELSACTEVKHLLGKFCFAGTGCPKIVDQEIFCTYTHKSVIIHAKNLVRCHFCIHEYRLNERNKLAKSRSRGNCQILSIDEIGRDKGDGPLCRALFL